MTKYEEYQLQWMIDHGYSLKDLLTKMDEIVDETCHYTNRPLPSQVMDDFEEVGFKESEIWACEDEWESIDKPIGEESICQICKEPLVKYGTFEIGSRKVGYVKWQCDNCGSSGYENYILRFIGHNNVCDKNGNEWSE